MNGKCNCGKKATSEWLIKESRGRKNSIKAVWPMKFCDNCTPKYDYNIRHMTKIDGRTTTKNKS